MVKKSIAKVPGVFYAPSSLGLELPIFDVAHPAFERPVDAARQRAYVHAFMREAAAPELVMRLVPGAARRALMRAALRGSLLASGIRAADGSFLGGMATYLFKVGTAMGEALGPVDRKIIASLPARAVRWRVFDMVELLVAAVRPRLAGSASRPLRLLNVAGGPAIDSLNAIASLARETPDVLRGRRVTVTVLDGDGDGPAFGERALAAWRDGGPLDGVDVRFERRPYDWNDTSPLERVLTEARDEDAVVVASSEGGLFEYGTDDAVSRNLRALREGTRGRIAVVGSVTRDDEPTRRMVRTSTAALVPRGLSNFRALAQRAGLDVTRSIARPFADDVTVEPMI